MLYTFAQADASGVRTYGKVELCRHEQHGEIFVDASDPAAGDLNPVDRARLHELLEHYPILAMFSGSYADRRDFAANAGVPQDVIRAGRLFHPPGIYFGEFIGALDRLCHTPLL